MSSWQEIRLTGAVKRHDPKLFVKKGYRGVTLVLREHFVHHAYDVDGQTIFCLEPAPHYIMALTDTWSASGIPCEWGVEPILERLKMIDGWNKQSFVNQEMEKVNEKADQSKQRETFNKIEDAAYESHSVFKKTFADINTASMKKIDKRKIKGA